MAFRNEYNGFSQLEQPLHTRQKAVFLHERQPFSLHKKAFLDITTSGTACYGCTRRIGVFTPNDL